MTRKDYILIAAALKRALDPPFGSYLPGDDRKAMIRRDGVCDAAKELADALAQDNPRFDCDRFLKAAGVSP